MSVPEATSPPRAPSRERATKKGGNGRSTAPGPRTRRRSIGGADTLRALYEVALAAARAADPAEIAGLAVEHARNLLTVDGAVVFVWDEATGLLQPLRETASDSEEPPVRPGEGAIGIAFDSGEAVIIPDYQTWSGSIPDSAKRGMVSAVAVPMRIGDNGIGALGIWTYAPRRFSTADVRLLSLFGAHIAPALEAARRNAQIEARELTLAALQEVSAEAGGGRHPAELSRLVVARARALLGMEGAEVYWERDGRLHLLAIDSLRDDDDAAEVDLDDAGAVGAAFRRRRPVIVGDYQSWPEAIAVSRRRGVAACMAVPLIIGDRPRGALAVWTYAPHEFGPEEVQLLALFGGQVAPAIEVAGLVEAQQARAGKLLVLYELALAASGVTEPEELASRAEQLAAVILEADVKIVRGGEQRSARRPGTVLELPLVAAGSGLGVLRAERNRRHPFQAADRELAALTAALVAPALAAAQLHASLAASEGRFRSLHQTMAAGLLVQGPEGVVMDANKAAEELFGVPLPDMQGRHSSEFWQAFDENGAEMPFGARPAVRALRTGEAVRGCVLQVETRQAVRRWLRVDAIPVPAPEGGPTIVVSSLVDISAERRAEEALRESEERFRAIFDHAALGIIRLDLKARVMEANPAVAGMLGRQVGDLLGRDIGDFILAEDRNPKLFRQLARGQTDTVQLEMRLLAGRGNVVWANTIASLVRDRAGNPGFVVAMFEDISTRKSQEAALAHQALHDALTELPNRVLLHDRLNQAIRFAARSGRHAGLLLMDLDGFKEINDTFGHVAGDVMLRQVARRLREALRGSDTVSRLGGDEFAIVLQHLPDAQAASHTARKILNALEAPFRVEGERLNIGASIGIALYPDHGEDAGSLLRRGDVAMYVAKRSGSGVSVYSPDEDRHSPARLSLVTGLRDAIRDGGLVMHYQPKVRLADGCTTGVEALARWRHPELGVVSPDDFIPLAEQAGLIRALGAWALGEVFQQQRRWRDAGVVSTVAVNISALQLRDPDLPDHLEALVRQHGLEPSLLILEITESSLMEDPERAIEILRRLTATGVRVSIDDFGTGYSSLAYLRRLPAAELKIDRSLISDVTRSESDAVIVRSTIDLGHNLGMEVVAEGVENAETRRLLTEFGCDLAQGFLFAKPLSAREVALRMRRQTTAAR